MSCYFFFNHPPTTEISTLSLHDALPIYVRRRLAQLIGERREEAPLGYERERPQACALDQLARAELGEPVTIDRKSTRLNSSHTVISYAVFCLKKKRTRAAPGPGPPPTTS